jgi:hypothetical protein
LRTFRALPAAEQAALRADLRPDLRFVLAESPDIPAARRFRVRHAFLAAALRFAETRFLAVLRAVLRFVVAMLMTPYVMKNMD